MIPQRKSVAIMLFALLPVAAFATTSWMKTFKGLYKPGSGSDLRKAKCAACHVKPNGKGGLNSYGKLLDGKDVSEASLKSVESMDPDKDGANNIKEIKAGKLPGDSASKP